MRIKVVSLLILIFLKSFIVYSLAPTSNVPTFYQSIYGLMEREHFEYCLEVCKVVNPESKPLKGVYGFSGPDVSSFLLSTNAAKGVFITSEEINIDIINFWIINFPHVDNYEIGDDGYLLQKGLFGRRRTGFWHYMAISQVELARMFLFELKKLGIKRSDILGFDAESKTLRFKWQHPSGGDKVVREISFIKKVIKEDDDFDELNMEEFDFFYTKGMQRFSADLMQKAYQKMYQRGVLAKEAKLVLGVKHTTRAVQNPVPYEEQLIDMKERYSNHDISSVTDKRVMGNILFRIPEQYGWRVMILVPLVVENNPDPIFMQWAA